MHRNERLRKITPQMVRCVKFVIYFSFDHVSITHWHINSSVTASDAVVKQFLDPHVGEKPLRQSFTHAVIVIQTPTRPFLFKKIALLIFFVSVWYFVFIYYYYWFWYIVANEMNTFALKFISYYFALLFFHITFDVSVRKYW